MHHLKKLRFLIVLGVAVCVLAACRAPAQTGAGSAGPAVNSPVSSPTGTVPATPTAGNTPTPGAVTLVLNKASYGPGETINVTIENRLITTIFAANHQSDCTLVQLERQNGGIWQAVAPCRLEIVTKIVALAAGSATLQILHPAGTSRSAGSAWPAGTYRIAFEYGVSSEEALIKPTVVYSATFVVS